MSTRKRIVLIAIALIVVALLWWSFQPAPVPVSVATVQRGPLQVTIQQDGMTRVRDRYVVAAPVTGHLERIRLDEGDPVKRGQVLVHVNPSQPEPLDPRTRAQAEAQVAEAEAAYAFARAELERLTPLHRRGDVSRSEFEQVRATAERARAALAAARAVLSAAEGTGDDAAGRVPVVAPVDGRVLTIERKSEGPVTAGAPLLAIGDPQSLEVAVDVLSTDAVRIVPGMRVWLERWGGPERLEARVRRIEPAAFTKVSALGVEEQRVWVILDIVSPRAQWQNLGDGYRVEASFVVWEEADVLQVPGSAVFREQGQWAAFVVEEGVARKRQVEIGRRGGLAVQILKGLAEGEQVITHPDSAVGDGVVVVIQ